MIGFEVKGDKALIRNLSQMENKVRGPIVRKAVRAAAKIVKEKAMKNAPKSTGMLRKAIKVKSMKRKVGRIGVAVLLSTATMPEWYGNVVEYGRTKKRPFEGRRFLTKAYEETKQQTADVIRRDLWQGIFGKYIT